MVDAAKESDKRRDRDASGPGFSQREGEKEEEEEEGRSGLTQFRKTSGCSCADTELDTS
jgi:hypothetical protein